MEQPSEVEWLVPDPQAALIEWMAAYGNSVWTFIYASVHSRELADDLTQEVFVRAFTHAGQFRGESTIKTWLFAIARNVVKDHKRSAYFRRVKPSDEMERYIERGTPKALDEATEDLWDVVMQLKPHYRELVILRLREDLAFSQIADITGSSEASARVRYQRAIKQIRKILGVKGGNDGD